MESFPLHIFRTYDIRGACPEELSREVAYRTGVSFAAMCRERTGREHPVVSVGMDARIHSPYVRDAFSAGLVKAGCSWIDLGLCPTPLTYFSAFRLPVDAFAMVTASHNPPGDNGLKLGIGRETIHSGDIGRLGRMAAQDRSPLPEENAGPGERVDIVALYREAILEAFADLGRKLCRLGREVGVAVDSGNGTAGVVFPGILSGLGFKAYDLYSEPDGTFPNHHPDPTLPEALDSLRKEIFRTGAGLGLSFDGDADRIGVLDETGEVIWGDMLLLVLGRDIIRRWREGGGEGAPPLVISEVKASQALYDGIREAGGRALMWKTGHSLIKAKMKETGAFAAGEMSGHLFFADRYYGYDDALYGALRILEVFVNGLLEGSCASFSDLFRDIPAAVSTPEIRVPCRDSEKFDVVARFARLMEAHRASGAEPHVDEVIDLDGVRARFRKGWGLVRASNTQPVLVLRFEASEEAALDRYRDLFHELLEQATGGSEKDP